LPVFFLLLMISCNRLHEDKRIKIGFSQGMTTDDWRKQMNKFMLIEASLHPEVDLTILDANDNVNNQIDDIEKLIRAKADVIIVSPIQSEPLVAVAKESMKAGIPILVVDRKIAGENYTAYLGADNIEVGRNAAKYIVSKGGHDFTRIVEIKGLAGSSPAFERSFGFNQIISQHDNFNVVATIDGSWEGESIKESFRKVLETHPKIDYVFVHNDRMALSTWEIAKEKGLENHIKIIGVDGLNTPNGGIQLVEENVLEATIYYPTGGNEAIRLALEINKNNSVPKNNILNTIVIDRINAEIMKNQLDKIDQQQERIDQQLNTIFLQDQKYYSQNNLLKILILTLILILILTFYSIYTTFSIRKKKRQLEIKNKKITVQRNQLEKTANEIREVNQARLNFFTGISHEFKTPLTLIISSVESLNDNLLNKSSIVNKEFNLIHNNSKRLLRLINQLLDYRKIEDRKFTIRVSKTNIYNFSKHIFDEFEREAKKRNINFTISTANEEIEVYLDRNLMDKVYFNLLSNAFKFTPDNGEISIKIREDDQNDLIKIYFKDSGIGIPAKEMKNVFEAFYQGSNNYRNSSGIGLYLSKSFVDLHKGKIEVSSKNGTEFVISLPKGKGYLSEKEIIIEQSPEWVNDIGHLDFEVISTIQNKNKDEEKYSILFIEDNLELLEFLSDKFRDQYNVFTSDGKEAIKSVLEIVPDIIVCDLNLPEKDGFEICEILKRDLRTSHIPTIILTALDNQESHIKALQSGADLYLTKPFNLRMLTQSINSLLYNREKLRYYYTNNIHKIEEGGFGISEQEFLKKLNNSIIDSFNDSSLSVEELADRLHMSRVQLYRKIKAILGISVSDHINNIRLEKAKEMLKSTDLNISEIAYAVGFSSPNYFSTAFKSKYGATPKEFKTS